MLVTRMPCFPLLFTNRRAERGHCELGSVVGNTAQRNRTPASNRRDVDDRPAPLRTHLRDYGLDAVERARSH